MIPLNFGLFHSGCKLSYLRYLSFKTLRYFHPNSKIQLYVSNKSNKSGHKWHREKQDFEDDVGAIDYVERLSDLGVEVIKGDLFTRYAPNFQSDFFRWWFLKNNGGFYLDTDQIILKSFETLPLNHKLIYSMYHNPQCGMYTPVGVIGADKDCDVVESIMRNIARYFDPNNYNSIGPFMFIKAIKELDMSNTFNAPANYFYPAFHSDLVPLIYSGKLKINDESFALHEFMGHPESQKFNKIYTEEFAKTSNDTISRFLREKAII